MHHTTIEDQLQLKDKTWTTKPPQPLPLYSESAAEVTIDVRKVMKAEGQANVFVDSFAKLMARCACPAPYLLLVQPLIARCACPICPWGEGCPREKRMVY